MKRTEFLGNSGWPVRAALIAAGWLGLLAGCSGPIYDEGPNNPPNTVFLDDEGSPNPAPGALVEVSSVTFRYTGTDLLDGDTIVAFYYRLSPPLVPGDTTWTRKEGLRLQTVTFDGLRDTTYEFCVYAEDIRGAVDPTPTCREFTVHVFHLGEIVIGARETRDGDYVFEWRLEGSDIAPEDVSFDIWLVQYAWDPARGEWVVADSGERQPATGTELVIVGPDRTRIYALSVFAEDSGGHQISPVRVCYPDACP